MKYKLILAAVLIGLFALFVLQNVAVVDIHFLFWTLSISRALLLAIVLAAGALAGWAVSGYLRHKQDKNRTDS